MAILIDIKKKKPSNVIYLADHRKEEIPFYNELAKLNKEIADYKKEAEKASEELKAKLFSAGDKHGKN